MKATATFLLAGALLTAAAPPAPAQRAPSPYHTRFAADGPIILGLGAVSGVGLLLGARKDGPTEAQLATLNRHDIPKFDRFAAGYYSLAAQRASDFIVYPTLLLAPGLLALNTDVRRRYGQVLVLYLETLAASNAVFSLTVGTVSRYRPLLYGPQGGSFRTGRLATNSFYSGHTANTASATFFAAKVYHDFHPGSAAEPFVWGAAAVVPAATAYFRIKAGKHFLSDNLVGYAVGATAGIVVPQLHKTAGRTGLSVVPVQGLNVRGYPYSGLAVTKRL